MHNSETTRITRSQKVALALTVTAFGVSLISLCYVCYLLRNFYMSTASFAPGTPIRPMGFTFALGIPAIASIVFGDLLALIAAIIALIQRPRRFLMLAILVAIFSWVPAIVGNWGFVHIVKIRQLVLSK